MLQGGVYGLAQCVFVGGGDVQTEYGQLDVVLFKAVKAGKALCGQKFAVYAQMAVAALQRPVRQLGVNAFAGSDQRREQAYVLASVALHDLRHDALGRLGLYGVAVVNAMLHAQLDVQQPQKVPNFGSSANGGFAPAAREALLNGNGWRYAIDGIYIGAACWLHQAAGVSVQTLKVAALAFVENNVKRQCGFTRAAYPRNHIKLPARYAYREVFKVVLVGVADVDKGGFGHATQRAQKLRRGRRKIAINRLCFGCF